LAADGLNPGDEHLKVTLEIVGSIVGAKAAVTELEGIKTGGLKGEVPGGGAAEAVAEEVQPGCFAAGTPLLTPGGSGLIETLRVGDRVLARPENDVGGAVEAKAVEQVFVRTSRIWAVRAGGRTIKTTPQHPLWVRDKGWVLACQVAPGDYCSSHDGQWVLVEGAEDTGVSETVYNVQVADYHTYFVGSWQWGFSVWAHNVKLCGKNVRDALEKAGLGQTNGAKANEMAEIGNGVDRPAAKGKLAQWLRDTRAATDDEIKKFFDALYDEGEPPSTPWVEDRGPGLQEKNPPRDVTRAGTVGPDKVFHPGEDWNTLTESGRAQKAMTDLDNASANINPNQQRQATKFFKGMKPKTTEYGASDLPSGGKRLQFTDASKSEGYRKLYVQDIDADGNVNGWWSEVVTTGNKVGKVNPIRGRPQP
jgi:hypothetical protein